MAFEASNGDTLNILVQQLANPVSLRAITLGDPDDSYTRDADGYELVMNRRTAGLQAVMVRPDGLMVNVIEGQRNSRHLGETAIKNLAKRILHLL
jgi:hypothetical protein